MSDPIHIPLSLTIRKRFELRNAQAKILSDENQMEITTLVADKLTPEQFATIAEWRIALSETEIVCTPPAAPPEAPAEPLGV